MPGCRCQDALSGTCRYGQRVFKGRALVSIAVGITNLRLTQRLASTGFLRAVATFMHMYGVKVCPRNLALPFAARALLRASLPDTWPRGSITGSTSCLTSFHAFRQRRQEQRAPLSFRSQLQPLAAMDKAKTYAERQQLQRAKEAEWNRALPHHVSFTDARVRTEHAL